MVSAWLLFGLLLALYRLTAVLVGAGLPACLRARRARVPAVPAVRACACHRFRAILFSSQTSYFDSVEGWLRCLLNAAVDDADATPRPPPAHVYDVCGHHPSTVRRVRRGVSRVAG